jgi:glycosyltransferase involved in cell wall biosynthesis
MYEISVLISTKNEAKDLPGCLASIYWCDDINIYDSMSSDETVEIAKSFGANIISRNYGDDTRIFGGNESDHRNWALKNIQFKYPWVLVIDADERVTNELRDSVNLAVSSPSDNVAFRIERRDFFLGTWLKNVQTSAYYIRLYQHQKVHYERLINPVVVVDGRVADISGYLDHFPFSKGLSHWIDRHNSYSTFEAEQIIENRGKPLSFSIIKVFFEKDFTKRRIYQKEFFYRLPFRPLIKFLILYLGKRGFLDGRAGFTYALLQSIYEYFIVLKTRELDSQDNN